MNDTPVELETYPIAGPDLDQINLQIADLEADAQEFVESKISPDKSGNEAAFRPLPRGKIPPRLTVILKGGSAPENAKLVWEGEMIVEGKTEDVEAYRAES